MKFFHIARVLRPSLPANGKRRLASAPHSRGRKRLAAALLLASLALPFLPLPAAEAHLGADIGIAFPMGASSSQTAGSVPTESYAAFASGSLIEELTVKERSGRLLLELKVTNSGDAPYTIEHRCGQLYDFALLDKNGQALYTWSDGMAFTQALTTSTIRAHASVIYQAEIKRADYKKIKGDAVLVTAWLTDTPDRLMARVPAQTAHTSNTGAIIGSIRIGNGHWYHG